jgi:transcriptional regulator with XRE-family HTH domain
MRAEMGSALRYCQCGTRLARDNAAHQCAACQVKARDLVMRPPSVPADFWTTDHMRDALATWDMGRVIAAYRNHRYHGRSLPQEIVAGWAGITQAQLSRIENGPPLRDLEKLTRWARILGIPAQRLWFKLPDNESVGPASAEDAQPASIRRPGLAEIGDVDRRELLQLVSKAGTLVVRLQDTRLDLSAATGPVERATMDEYTLLNACLWRVFALSRTKRSALPPVREQLDVLVGAFQQPHSAATHQRLCELAADLFQLAGEILFDGNRYTDAALCYTLAATASREADAFDLWACALTRHAFLAVYEGQFAQAAPLLELAAGLARRGDGALSTRYWVSAVQARAFAGLGKLDACERALDRAERVTHLHGETHNGGWLRFDGSRLAEERGACYITLGHPRLAEAALSEASSRKLSARRRGTVFADLAMVAVQRRDADQLVTYAEAAVDTMRQTGSAVVGRRLLSLQAHLGPFLGDGHVRTLDEEITALAAIPT